MKISETSDVLEEYYFIQQLNYQCNLQYRLLTLSIYIST